MKSNQVREIAEKFTNGTPVDKEIEFYDGDVIFHFDNPFDEDVKQSYVVASLLVDRNAFNNFNPYNRNSLSNVDQLMSVDSTIRSELTEGGFSSVSRPEFDETNTNSSHYVFTYTIVLD